jgi:hypothetical protein
MQITAFVNLSPQKNSKIYEFEYEIMKYFLV